MSKRAVLYARVSTDEQAEHGYSLPTQLAAMREYAAENGFVVVDEITDDYSGAKLDRQGLDAVRSMIEQHNIEVVVVYASDRLTRSLAHSLILREEWQRAGIELHTIARGKSENSAEGRLTENVEAVIAEYEREKIRERSRRGRIAKAVAGKWVGNSRPPFGYKRVGQRKDVYLVIEEEEATIVRWIFDLYTGRGGNKPEPLIRIARRLTLEYGPIVGRGGHDGTGWYAETINNILDRRAYIGEFNYAGHIIHLPELAIIDRETFEAARQQRERNKMTAKRNRRREYLLSGHFRCACSQARTGGTKYHTSKKAPSGRKERYFYFCVTKSRNKHLSTCNEGSVRAGIADALVWNWLLELLGDEDQLRLGLKRKFERDAAEVAPKWERLKIVIDLIGKAERGVKRLTSAFAAAEDDNIAEALNSELKTISRQREALNVERDRLLAELEQGTLTPEQEEGILAKAAQVRTGMINADFETKRYFLDRLDVQVRLRRDGTERWLDVTCNIANDGKSLPLEHMRGDGSIDSGRL